MVSVSSTSFNIVERSKLDLFYGFGCCWIEFEFACPQTFSLRKRAHVFSFPYLHPKPLALEHNKFPSGFYFLYVNSTIYNEKIDGLCTGSVCVI